MIQTSIEQRARGVVARARNGVARDLWLVIVLGAALIGLTMFIATRFIKPAPPDTLTLSTGAADGAYHAFAQRYQKVFEREGVKLELKPSNGSVDNLAQFKGLRAAWSI